jgi:hypothetical protein
MKKGARGAGIHAAVLTSLAATLSTDGDVTVFLNRPEWEIAVGGRFTTIGFTGFPDATLITDQYADLGIVFTDGNDRINFSSANVLDNWGLAGNAGGITAVFDEPQLWVGVNHPGGMKIDLFSDGVLIYDGDNFGSGYGLFRGLLSTEPFDRVVFSDLTDTDVFIDDLHFGPARCLGDLDGDAVAGISDFLDLVAAWGPNPGHPADLDGDGLVSVTDFLALLARWGPCHFFVDCNGNGVFDFIDMADGTSPDCNVNAVPDECDLADGTSSDFNDNGIPDECDLTNDECEDAIVITDGATDFITYSATPSFPSSDCGSPLDDVWFRYTGTCLGYATFSLCNAADFDTFLAVYSGASCPPAWSPLACSDDAPGCGVNSEVTVLVFEGSQYTIRLGSLNLPEQGSGTLSITCEPLGPP